MHLTSKTDHGAEADKTVAEMVKKSIPLRWFFEWVNMEYGVTLLWYDTQRVYAVKKAVK